MRVPSPPKEAQLNEPAHEIKVRVFVRHKATCEYSGEEGYARCRCAKWLRYSRHGKQFRQSANTRSFGTAEEKARELERRSILAKLSSWPNRTSQRKRLSRTRLQPTSLPSRARA